MFLLLPMVAVPVAVAAQGGITFSCPEARCHVAPWFNGEGGFIGKLDKGYKRVTFVMECGRDLFINGVATPDASGVVARVLTEGNGWHCDDDGRIWFVGFKDGGWYWIDAGTDRQVASILLPAATLKNRKNSVVEVQSDDTSMTVTPGQSLSILKQASTGNIAALLPRIWPKAEGDAPEQCGPRPDSEGSYADPDRELRSLCLVGEGKTKILLKAPDEKVGSAEARIRRRSVDLPIAAGVYLEGGSISTADPPTPAKGWNVEGGGPLDVSSWGIKSVRGSGPGEIDPASAGIALAADTGVITISPSSTYCDPVKGVDEKVRVEIRAVTDPRSTPVIPLVKREHIGTFEVLCGQSSLRGRDLARPYRRDGRHTRIGSEAEELPRSSTRRTPIAMAARDGITFSCPEAHCHVAPWFNGEGGFVGKLDKDYEELTFVMECGDLFAEGVARPDANGVLKRVLTRDDGWHCNDDGRIWFVGLEDGGWYWIGAGTNRQVASILLPAATLKNRKVSVVEVQSDDISMRVTSDGSTSILSQASTSSIALLPRIWPEAEEDAPEECGPRPDSEGSYADPDRELNSLCLVGEGNTRFLLKAPGDEVVSADARVHRRSGDFPIAAGVYLEGGSISTADPPTPAKGWNVEGGEPLDVSSWGMSVRGSGPGEIDPAAAGIALAADTGVITISPSSTYCDPVEGVDEKVRVEIRAVIDSRSTPVIPLVKPDERDGSFVSTTLVVLCQVGGQSPPL